MARPPDNLPGLGLRTLSPRLIGGVSLAKLKLTSSEAYVISRIDGKTSLWEVCLLVPMERDLTLDILRWLRQEGLIDIPGSTEPMPQIKRREIPRPSAAPQPAPVAAPPAPPQPPPPVAPPIARPAQPTSRPTPVTPITPVATRPTAAAASPAAVRTPPPTTRTPASLGPIPVPPRLASAISTQAARVSGSSVPRPPAQTPPGSGGATHRPATPAPLSLESAPVSPGSLSGLSPSTVAASAMPGDLFLTLESEDQAPARPTPIIEERRSPTLRAIEPAFAPDPALSAPLSLDAADLALASGGSIPGPIPEVGATSVGATPPAGHSLPPMPDMTPRPFSTDTAGDGAPDLLTEEPFELVSQESPAPLVLADPPSTPSVPPALSVSIPAPLGDDLGEVIVLGTAEPASDASTIAFLASAPRASATPLPEAQPASESDPPLPPLVIETDVEIDPASFQSYLSPRAVAPDAGVSLDSPSPAAAPVDAQPAEPRRPEPAPGEGAVEVLLSSRGAAMTDDTRPRRRADSGVGEFGRAGSGVGSGAGSGVAGVGSVATGAGTAKRVEDTRARRGLTPLSFAAIGDNQRQQPTAPEGPPPPVELPPEQQQRIDALYDRLNSIDAFSLLGVTPSDEKRTIQRAYFKLSKEFHPDRFYNKHVGIYGQRVASIFQAITEARDTLVDDDRRAAYLAGQPR